MAAARSAPGDVMLRSPTDLLRARGERDEGKVAFVELFFDLVFVFAITQLSHTLLHHFSLAGALETTLLFLAVWWVWIFTTWATNWLDPRRTAVRLMLFALMLAGLVMSMSIPEAFGERGLGFALAYAFSQVGRSLFMLWASAGRSAANYRNFQRITCWLSMSAIFWIVGGMAHGEWRVALWVIALAIEYLAPAAGFWAPRLGRTPTADWNVSGAHMAERCGLFIIICLGESILVTGANFARMSWTLETVSAFVVAFVGSVVLWWIYFHIGHERASHVIQHSSDPGRIARLSFTYLHIPLVAGVILAAASDEFLLAHPADEASTEAATALLGGPALFLLGNLLFKGATSRRLPLSHLIGLVLLGGLALTATALSTLALGAVAAAILIVTAVWERLSLGPIADTQSLGG
jgi:low temperature requirement protein LtrA